MMTNYLQITSDKDQRPSTTGPTVVTMNRDDFISGIEHTAETGTLKILETGIYVVICAPQVGRLSGTENRYVDFWLRQNGKDLDDSNVRLVVGNKGSKDVIVNQTMMPFKAGDTLNVMMSVEVSDEGLGIEAIKPDDEPLIPSIIFSMHKIRD